MSGNDDPFSGGGGKTIIRPTPGGGGGGGNFRRPEPPQQPWQPPRPPGQPQAPWPAQPNPAPWSPPGLPEQQGYNPRVNAPSQFQNYSGAGGMPNPGGDDWLRGNPAAQLFPQQGAAPAPQVETRKIPLEVALNARDGGQISAANPITAAAAPLLILLGRLRMQIVDVQAVPLMQHVANEIVAFERKVLAANVDPNDARVAKYALCGTADDIVQNLPGENKHVWLQYSMLAQFFQVRTSGVGFYEELAKILHNPAPKYDLLELMHACLSLGFEGQYRGAPNGANELQRLRRDVYQTLRHLKSRSDEDISPRWRGLDLKMRSLTSRVPLWVIGSAAAALLLAVYFVLRLLLGQGGDVLADRLIALHPSSPIGLVRASTFVPAVIADTRDQTQLERIRTSLGVVDKDCVAADSVGDEIVIRVCNVLLFDSGSAKVKPDFAELASKIAASMQNEPGPIMIIGHTDNVKPSGLGRFKSNFDLSVARAEAVEKIIAKDIKDTSRIQVEGRGETDPIAGNDTAEGRSKNRRVEIMIPREETLSK